MSASPATPPPAPPWQRSIYVLGTLVCVLFGVFLCDYSVRADTTVDDLADPALCSAVKSWRQKYPPSDDLQVNLSRVTFRGVPRNFVSGEGIIVAPLAVSLPGAQEVLEVGANPPPLRVLKVEGTTALSWEYAGAVTRDIRALGFALVRRPRDRVVELPSAPTFDTLEHDLRVDLPTPDRRRHRGTARRELQGVPSHGPTAQLVSRPIREKLFRIVHHLNEHLRLTR